MLQKGLTPFANVCTWPDMTAPALIVNWTIVPARQKQQPAARLLLHKFDSIVNDQLQVKLYNCQIYVLDSFAL